MYRFAMAACTPAVRWWGRLEVTGLDALPAEGPVLLAGNHDSYWDPVAVGISGLPRRQIKALTRSARSVQLARKYPNTHARFGSPVNIVARHATVSAKFSG